MNEDINVVFPQRVHEVDQNSRVSSSQALKIGIFLWALAMTFFSFVIAIPFFLSRGFPVWIYWLIMLAVNGLGFVYVWRFGFFKETEKIIEMEQEDLDSFSRYCMVRSISPTSTWERKEGDIPIFQYKNSGVFIVMRFTFGSNNLAKSAANELFFENIYREIHARGLEFSDFVGNEEFSRSPEALRWLSKLEKCKDPVLQSTVSKLTKELFQVSKEESDTEVYYLIVRGKTRSYTQSIFSLIYYIENQLEELTTSFREVMYCGEDEYVNLLKEYYRIPVIDGSRIRVDSVEEEMNYISIDIYSVTAEDGTTLVNKDFIPKYKGKVKRIS